MDRTEQLLIEIGDALAALRTDVRALRDRPAPAERSLYDRLMPPVAVGAGCPDPELVVVPPGRSPGTRWPWSKPDRLRMLRVHQDPTPH
jgi:hypothetical protein